MVDRRRRYYDALKRINYLFVDTISFDQVRLTLFEDERPGADALNLMVGQIMNIVDPEWEPSDKAAIRSRLLHWARRRPRPPVTLTLNVDEATHLHAQLTQFLEEANDPD